MIDIQINGLITITCDKCQSSSISTNDTYNETFLEQGWALHRGRKYMHLCRKCLPKKSREAMDWVKGKFLKKN